MRPVLPSLLSGRKDITVISSVSCIYGLGILIYLRKEQLRLN